MRLAGKVALVTGAQQGIGRAIAVALARDGADVGVNYLDDRDAAEEVGGRGPPVQGVARASSRATSRGPSDAEAMVGAAARELGTPAILVNNAGVFPRVDFLAMTEADWDHVLDVNLKGSFLCAQAAARRMVDAGAGGAIVNLASVAMRGTPLGVHYSASKAGVMGLTRAMALALAPHRIRVNAIAPGLTDTAQPRYGNSEAELVDLARQIPLDGPHGPARGDRPRRRVPRVRGIRAGSRARRSTSTAARSWGDRGQPCDTGGRTASSARWCCRSTSTRSPGSSSASRRRPSEAWPASRSGASGPASGSTASSGCSTSSGCRRRSSFPGWTVENHRPQSLRIKDAGHEIGAHGNVHEAVDGLDAAQEEAVMRAQLRILADQLGRAPGRLPVALLGRERPDARHPEGPRLPLRQLAHGRRRAVRDRDQPRPADRGARPVDPGRRAALPPRVRRDQRHRRPGARVRPVEPGVRGDLPRERLLRPHLPPVRHRARLAHHAAGGAGRIHPPLSRASGSRPGSRWRAGTRSRGRPRAEPRGRRAPAERRRRAGDGARRARSETRADGAAQPADPLGDAVGRLEAEGQAQVVRAAPVGEALGPRKRDDALLGRARRPPSPRPSASGRVSQRKNPPSVRVHLTPSGISRASASYIASRRARYAARRVWMCAASPPCFMKVPTTIEAKPFVLPSALKARTRSITAGSARTNPSRTPGATIFEKVPSRITRPSRSSAWRVGTGSPSKRRSR